MLAGGGSFLTLPLLIFLGLPPGVANGTNRVGILLQNSAAVVRFSREKVLDRRLFPLAAVPAAVGAVAGAGAALWVDDSTFKRVLAVLMIVLTLWTYLGPSARPRERPLPSWLLALGFFGVGLYGGFVQAGVGFLLLAMTSAAGLDLVRGNALKVHVILLFTVLALAVFASQGKVEWLLGLVLGAGAAVGGWLGARLTLLKGHAWLRTVVIVAVLVFAVRLLFF